jgi:hypothetical protein
VDGSVNLNIDFRIEGGSTRMQLHLAPYGSVFVIFAQPIDSQRSLKLAKAPEVTSVELPADQWTITFQKDRGAPSGAQKLPGFTSWTEWPDAGVRYFPGTATYRTDFDGRHAAGDRILVALTDLHEICTVRINGKPAGVIWAMLYQLDVTGVLKDGTNTLELDVTNLWPNRIIGDAQPSNTHAYTSTNIRKYTASSPLLPSGLIGPVTIQTIRVTGGRTAQAAHLAPHSRLRAQGKSMEPQLVTVMVRVAVCWVMLEPLPLEAVMVMMSDPLGVPGSVGAEEAALEPPPPHPSTGLRHSAAATNKIARYFKMRLRLVTGSTNRKSAAVAIPLARRQIPPDSRCSMALVAAAVVMVNWVATGLPLGVTLVGEKTQLASEGSPAHAKVTARLKPFCGVTVKVTNPDLPLLMERLAGLEATEKLGVGSTG